jgi:hypothetical protein
MNYKSYFSIIKNIRKSKKAVDRFKARLNFLDIIKNAMPCKSSEIYRATLLQHEPDGQKNNF